MLSLRRTVSVAFGVLAIAAAGAATTPEALGAPPTVYFIGDSVTAGFGYCGTESITIPGCTTNKEYEDNWFGENGIKACQPPEPVDDRCSNNNDKGSPWNAGPWKRGTGAPTVAYPYVIAGDQSHGAEAQVQDWAMTGSTPADWDPAGGRFGYLLARIKNSYVVMTLGANPLLSDYLRIEVLGHSFVEGVCSGTVVGGPLTWYALDPKEGPNSVLTCFNEQWTKLKQSEHLENVYKTLLANGDKVLVVGYPRGCPWSFGYWEQASVDGPSVGYSCKSLSYPNVNNHQQKVTQWQQAQAVGARLTAMIARAISNVRGIKPINFVVPGVNWEEHQAWDPVSWFFKNDTWIHPNPAGHQQLAATVTAGMCRYYGRWCGRPVRWTAARRRQHRRGRR